MKIEKVNDHQIRCTLTKADLADRELKISELAYGTEKAKSLFRDMMQQANLKFGFEADDIPLMIEAIPLNSDCIVLIITKVEDPEELDTRFSKFAPSVHEGEDFEEDSTDDLIHASEEVLDLFQKIKNHAASLAKSDAEEKEASDSDNKKNKSESKTEPSENTQTSRIFSFHSMHDILKPASFIGVMYQGDNFLYKDPKTGHYFLLITRNNDSTECFNRVCNALSEYGQIEKTVPAVEAYFDEHFELILGPNALQNLVFE